MNKSEQINELAAALAKAQAKIETAKKDQTNPFYKSQYAGLPQVWDACRKYLTDNGLSVVQTTDTSENGTILETMLLHSSGQWISSIYPVNPVKNDPQGIGSALTYARRYSLMALVGVVADDASDDDGNAASDKQGSAIGQIMNPRTSGPSDTDAGLTRIGHFKKEGEERAREGTASLSAWWMSLLKSDQVKMMTYKDTVLKPMAEAADRESEPA